MLDLIVAIVVIAAMVGIISHWMLATRLLRTRDIVVRAIAGMNRDLANVQSVVRSHGARLDKLDRSRAFSAEQEERIGAIETRCQVVHGCMRDSRLADGADD